MSLSMMSISMLTKSVSSSVRRGLAMIALWSVSAIAMAEYRLNFQDPVTEVARDIYSLHMLIFWICVAIFVAVFSVMFYSIFKHRKSKNYEPAKFSHSTSVEIVWTVIPFLILIAMAIPATQVLIKMEDTTKSDLTIKITGYSGNGVMSIWMVVILTFSLRLQHLVRRSNQFDVENAEPQGENYLLETDNHLVVPSGRKVRALITANDVIHAWWIPAFGSKKDAIPGYINELWFRVDEGKEGIYRGQCAELCGKDHAFMPIVVEVVTGDEFDAWVAAGGSFDGVEGMAEEASAQDAGEVMAEVATDVVDAVVPAVEAAEPVSAKTYTKEELIAKGAEVASNCLACHGADGKGIPGVFPAVAGSAIATGPIEDHIDIVMFGKAGTAMAAFAGQLSDEDIAAVITYQRNSYGNDTGDVVLPSDIKAKRQ